MKIQSIFLSRFFLLTLLCLILPVATSSGQALHDKKLSQIEKILLQGHLPELEIDENQDSDMILEKFFELISTQWAGDYNREHDKLVNQFVDNLEQEFNEQINRADKRLLELTHLMESQPTVAPYFSSFYFRQIADLNHSFNNIIKALQVYELRFENNKKQLANSLLMVKELRIDEPELQWQKFWIIRHVQPLIDNLDIWLAKVKGMINRAETFQKKIDQVFREKEEEIRVNYTKYYSHQFDFFGNNQGTRTYYQLREILSQFEQWQFTVTAIWKVILPDKYLFSDLLVFFFFIIILSLSLGLYLYRRFPSDFLFFLRPALFLVAGIFFFVALFRLPSTNDIIVFTLSGGCLTFACIDTSWKLRKKWTESPGMNPLVGMIPAFVLIDICTSLLIPVKVLLMLLLLLSIIELAWIVILFSKYRYETTEKVFAGLLAATAWTASGIAAWQGYLYPSMMIAIISGLTICVLYSGLVFTHVLVEYAGKISHRRLAASFVFTLMIPLLWLGIILGAIRWTGQIFNAGRILQNIYNTDLLPSVSVNICPKLILFLFLLALLIKFVLNWIRDMLELFSDASKMDPGSLTSAFLIFQYIVWILFITYMLAAFNVDFKSISIILGGLSIGFGFAFKNIIENFVCGLILLIGKEIRPGDVVEFDGTMGTVEKINIRATFIQTFDNAIITLPNNQVVSSNFRNWTLNNHIMRRSIDVGVAYGSDIEKVVKLLLKAGDISGMVLQVKEPEVLFWNFGDSSLIFRLRIWIHVKNYIEAPSKIRMIIDNLFRQHNVIVAFPQLDVHLSKEVPDQESTAPPKISA